MYVKYMFKVIYSYIIINIMETWQFSKFSGFVLQENLVLSLL